MAAPIRLELHLHCWRPGRGAPQAEAKGRFLIGLYASFY